jgi:tRNA A37 threonylcarbamoyladenosine synthetase subunit TsaC/SUA5/YrdC
MSEIIRIKRLRKDGTADPEILRPVITCLREGSYVLLPIDGVYGIAHKSEFGVRHAEERQPDSEYIVCDFGLLEKRARYSKADYDFLKRVWPDEVSVLMHAQKGAQSVLSRMPQTQVSQDIIHQSGGAIDFVPLLNEKGKPIYKIAELEKKSSEKVKLTLLIDEWCKPHLLPTVIDIRQPIPMLVRAGKVAMDEISSLFYLGPADDNA